MPHSTMFCQENRYGMRDAHWWFGGKSAWPETWRLTSCICAHQSMLGRMSKIDGPLKA